MTSCVEPVDVLVVGGGPAGMAAAACAAEQGARVLLADEGTHPGGQIWRASLTKASPDLARRWTDRLTASGARVSSSTSVVDVQPLGASGFAVTANRSTGSLPIEARRLILATGARERFLPFPGWTLPNVFGIGGAQALLKSGMSFHGLRVVIAGSGPLLLPVAAALSEAGANLVLVAEQAPTRRVVGFAASLWRSPSMLIQAAKLRSAFMMTPYATGTWITAATGSSSVRSAVVTDGRRMREIACDVVCAAFGLVPNVELARLVGCVVSDGFVRVDERQATTIEDVFCAGEPTGIGGVELSLVEGEIAGRAATGSSISELPIARRGTLRRYTQRLGAAFSLRSDLMTLAKSDTIICRCEDVRLGDLHAAWSSRQAKLYTRAGMGPCQGRICGAALESMLGWTADSVRPPVQPTRLAAMLASRESTERTH